MNELVKIEEVNALEVFTKERGLDPLLDAITREVESFDADTTTSKGRKEIASLANKVAKAKVLLDGMGKDLTSGWKAKAKVVDSERKRMRDILEALKVTARKPLTEFEEAEQAKDDEIKARIQKIRDCQEAGMEDGNSADEVFKFLCFIKETFIDESFGEFANAAATVKDAAILKLEKRFIEREKLETQQEELRVLREKEAVRQKEDDERKRIEYEENLKKEAAEKARLQAEEKAKKDSEKKERERLDAIKAKEAAEKLIKENEEKRIASEKKANEDKILAAEKADRDKEEAAEKVEEDKRLAEEKSERDKQSAIKAERERIEAEEYAKKQEDRKREQDVEHRRKVNKGICEGLIAASGITKKQSEAIATEIVRGTIAGVKVVY